MGLLPPARLTFGVIAKIASIFKPGHKSVGKVADDAEIKEKPMGLAKQLLTHVLQCAKAAWDAGTTHVQVQYHR